MSKEFVHLHVHTQYSLLDGFSQIPKLMERAKEMNMGSMGITDHGTMFGVIDFFNAAKANDIKPIIGVEAYLAARTMNDRENALDRKSSHLLLLAESQVGYKNLLKISSAAQTDGFYYYPRIDRDFLADHAEGLIVTSGCMGAEIPQALLKDNPDEARRRLSWYYDVFGKDNFFVELQDHDIPEIPKLNRELIELGKEFDLKFVATNDVHYVDHSDAHLQDIMLCVQTSSVFTDPKRMRMTDNSYYLKSAAEMDTLFGHIPGAMENTLLIAERCDVDLSTDGYVLPDFEVPEGYTVKSYLRTLCDQGLEMRYGDDAKKEVYQTRLEYELGIIDEMGFNAYFLIVWDMCKFSQRENIWYNARGSAAGSLVAYALEITLVDPIHHNLIFERFLNPGRVSMPDIDLDFQDDKRYLLLEYTAQKYGDDMVAAIITFGKMKARAAVRDVGRVLDVPLHEVDRISKLIPSMPGTTIAQALETEPDLRKEYQTKPYIKELIDTAQQIEGSLRNVGTHAAGVVITDKPVVEYIPLHRPTGKAEDAPIKTVTQFEMQTIDALGLLKVDFLGLSTLTIMQRACALIEERHGVKLDLHNIPLDDPATYEMLGNGDTAGVFQLEGGGMTRWVMEMKPHTLDNVIAMVALYRPGPLEFIPSYVRRMHGEEEISYRHHLLEPILKETYGITVYQEQIMFTAMNLGGYTASEADFLRKSVAKKKEKELLKNREKFVAGAAKNGVSQEAAEGIFSDWEAFARYGFPKGHAADYAVIAVETAYLKCHYPVEYMTALLSVSKSDTDKIAFYIADCRSMGIDVVQPNINKSGWDFTIEDDEDGSSTIRFGMGAIKNVGHGPVEAIIEARKEGAFEDLNVLSERLDLRKVGKRAFESLVKAGALDTFGPRLALLNSLEKIMSISTATFKAAEAGQLSFFGMDSGMTQRIELQEVNEHVNQREMLNWERDLIGLYISDHPLNKYMEEMKHVISHFSSQLALGDHESRVRVFGQVNRMRTHITKKGDQMAFVSLEDTQGMMDLVVFPRTWAKFKELIDFDNILIVEGKLDTEQGDPKILVDMIKTEATYVLPLQKNEAPEPGSFAPSFPVNEEKKQPYFPEAKQLEIPPAPEFEPVPEIEKPRPVVAKEPIAEELIEDNSLPEEILDASISIEKPIGIEKDVVAAIAEDEPKAQIEEIKWDGPPAPPAFDDGWLDYAGIAEDEEGYVTSEAKPAASEPEVTQPQSLAQPASPEESPAQKSTDSAPTSTPEKPPTVPAGGTEISVSVDDDELARQKALPTFSEIVPDRPAILSDGKENQKMVTVIIRASHDKVRDILRIRRIHGMLLSYHGYDKFAIYLIENGRGIRLEYPSDTTLVNDELRERLEQVVGHENVRIERIVLQ